MRALLISVCVLLRFSDASDITRQSLLAHDEKILIPSTNSLFHEEVGGGDQCKHFKHAAPQTPQGRCEYIQRYCSNEEDAPGILNYLEFYYCTMSNREGGQYFRWLALLIMTLDLIFLFIFIGTASADFFCPNLASLSDYIGLPPDVAGVTFLALGNSSPDLFSSLVAIHYAGSVTMALGELLGAALLVAGVVVAAVILSARSIQDDTPCDVRLKKSVFLRDIGFLLASVVILGLTVADGKLFYWEGLIMVLVYILYVLTVIIMGMVTKRMARKQASESIRRTPSSASSLRSKDPFEQNPRRTSINDAIGVLESSESASQLTAADLPSHFVHEMWANGVRDSKRQAGAIWICIRTYLFPIFIQWPERKLIGRFVAVLNIVPTLALSLTTPCVCEAAEIEGENNGNDFEEIAQFLSTHSPDGTKSSPVQDNISISAPYLSADAEEGEQEEKVPLLSSDASTAVIGRKDGLFKVRLGGEHPGIVDITNYRYILYVQSILIPIFVAIVVASTFLPITDASSSTYMTGLTFGAITGLVLFVMTFSIFRKIPARRILKSPVVSLIGFIMGIFWIYFVAKEIVGLLKSFAKIFDLSDSLLGMTVFAMGNSIGDLVSNVTMSRRGFPTMSIAACFAGPLMNILLTMGISGLLNWGNVPMLLKISLNLQIAYVGLIIMLAVIVMCVWTNNFVISRRLSWFILVLYAVVVIASSVADYLEI